MLTKLNQADSLIYQTEKNLKEYEDKISAENKAKIEASFERLKEVHKERNFDEIDSALEQLNQAWNAASTEMYGAQEQAGGDGAAAEASAEPDEQEVKDVDFEVVEDDEDPS